GALVYHQRVHEAPGQGALQGLQLAGAGHHAHAVRVALQRGEVGPGRAAVHGQVLVRAVPPEEDGGDVAHHALLAEGRQLGVLHVTGAVNVGVGVRRADAVQHYVGPGGQVAHALHHALAVHGVLGGGVVEVGGYGQQMAVAVVVL